MSVNWRRSVTDAVDADLLEIIDRQSRQHLEIDVVVPERLLIGLQSEMAQPISDVQLVCSILGSLPHFSSGRRSLR
jgi:hypothetical protein